MLVFGGYTLEDCEIGSIGEKKTKTSQQFKENIKLESARMKTIKEINKVSHLISKIAFLL